MTPAPDHNRFTAGACQYAASVFAGSDSPAQRAFAPTLEQWGERFMARDAEQPEQLEMFEAALSPTQPEEEK